MDDWDKEGEKVAGNDPATEGPFGGDPEEDTEEDPTAEEFGIDEEEV